MPHAKVAEHLRKNARGMRKVMTDAELRLWNELRAHRLVGMGFRRQLPIGGYIVDFACPARKLIVEVDGPSHSDDGQIAYDARRTAHLAGLGWTVLRFTNEDVLYRLGDVCTHLVRAAGLATPEVSLAE